MTGRYVRSTFVEDQREFVEHLQIGKQIGKLLDMPKRPQAQKHIFVCGGGGAKYNSVTSTFKMPLKKRLDSEDADRRDSMTRFIFSSFCQADEKLYNKPVFSLPNGKTQKSV